MPTMMMCRYLSNVVQMEILEPKNIYNNNANLYLHKLESNSLYETFQI